MRVEPDLASVDCVQGRARPLFYGNARDSMGDMACTVARAVEASEIQIPSRLMRRTRFITADRRERRLRASRVLRSCLFLSVAILGAVATLRAGDEPGAKQQSAATDEPQNTDQPSTTNKRESQRADGLKGDSVDLKFKQEALARAEVVLDLIADRILRLATERQAPSRVYAMQSAENPVVPIESFPYRNLGLVILAGLCAPFALAILKANHSQGQRCIDI